MDTTTTVPFGQTSKADEDGGKQLGIILLILFSTAFLIAYLFSRVILYWEKRERRVVYAVDLSSDRNPEEEAFVRMADMQGNVANPLVSLIPSYERTIQQRNTQRISQNRSSGRVFGRVSQQRSTQSMSQNQSSARVQEAQKEMIPLTSLIPKPPVDPFPSSSQSTEKEDEKVDEVLNESTDVLLPPATLFCATATDADRKSKKTEKRLVHRSETSKDKPKPTGGDDEILKEFSADISPPSILFNASAAPTADASAAAVAAADNGGVGNLEDSKKRSKHYSEPVRSLNLKDKTLQKRQTW